MIINTLLALLLAVSLGLGTASASGLQSVGASKIDVEQVNAAAPDLDNDREEPEDAGYVDSDFEHDDEGLADDASYPASHTYTFDDEADEL